MCITNTAVLSMHDISKWFLVGGKDADYTNYVTFDEAWNHQDKDKHRE